MKKYNILIIILQAFHKHKLVDPLENPGVSDLTADVDFSQLRISASMTPGEENYAIVLGPVKQMEFLERLQANVRVKVGSFLDVNIKRKIFLTNFYVLKCLFHFNLKNVILCFTINFEYKFYFTWQ